jgi:hypothetical protein
VARRTSCLISHCSLASLEQIYPSDGRTGVCARECVWGSGCVPTPLVYPGCLLFLLIAHCWGRFAELSAVHAIVYFRYTHAEPLCCCAFLCLHLRFDSDKLKFVLIYFLWNCSSKMWTQISQIVKRSFQYYVHLTIWNKSSLTLFWA